ncbi:leucine-rich repeat-containing protein 9 isoform X2 [Nerophis ophidion]|uniref:leucine-rich repeat-containing protein 9 isoform X2 n=1 Tax=Nerophis ophidion TaxID=159077 RepID=UPI002ADF2A3A|nr:leucine-rich repeat-containing protein 9 isoform X2 [Nerophis ophidion]
MLGVKMQSISRHKSAKKSRESLRRDEEVVKEMCMANGISYDDLSQEELDITSLEIFLSGFPRMVGLSYFPKLRHLNIVGQDIKRIEGLESLPLLQELWVVQCKLTKISGLQYCLGLRKLFLYDNKINEIKKLKLLVNIEVLWLNNNSITHIQGLNKLQKLKELNLADNYIQRIGSSLDNNVNLHSLNLSGNKICSFKELTRLTCLRRLRELTLSDSTSIPNPVCRLCNYATHVLYHLPLLLLLDTYDVSSVQVKEAAESTVMKKMMFYNMRARTAQQNLSESRLQLMEKKKASLESSKESIWSLNYTLKNLERELWKKSLEDSSNREVEDFSAEIDTSDPPLEEILQKKNEKLKKRLALWIRRLHETESWYQQNLDQITCMMEDTVQFLLTELQSVGNIRLEEGSTTDPWFNSCHELLLSRFSRSDYTSLGVFGVKVNRVIRIHNSVLRLRFKEKLQSLLVREDSAFTQNHKRLLEHLFYIADSEQNTDDVLCILEDGFKTAKEYKAMGKEAAVPLSNSLIVSEQPRIEYFLAEQGCPKKRTDKIPYRYGKVILAKVFLGHSKPIREGQPVQRRSYPRASSVYRYVSAKHQDRAHCGSHNIPRAKQWFVFDHDLVLPEYIICFEYTTGGSEQLTSIGCCIYGQDPPTYDLSIDKQALDMEPVLEPQTKLSSLDEEILLNVSRASVLSEITVLNLHNNSLSNIKKISSLPALRHLTISFNELTSLRDIAHMPNLEFLDVSYNQLVSLEGLCGLEHLRHLDVSCNKLTNARKDSAVLRVHTPALLNLETQHNPWSKPEEVRMTILSQLTTLKHLDDILVTQEETADAIQKTTRCTINQESLVACSYTNNERPRYLSLLPTTQLLSERCPSPRGLSQNLQPDWTTKITALNFDNQKICKMSNLGTLVNLRWASFNNNYISEVEGLDCCIKLEDLSLNNNSISSFHGLSNLQCLSKLSMDGNQLSSLDNSILEELQNLTFLAVENNRITSLQGIQRIRNLLELYVGNNQISVSRDVYYVKGLANLIILDLYGNPLCESLKNYRIYMVFHLPSLKALDGTAVDAAECENAKATFGGRLTPDLVAEKLDHSNYADITNLNLPSCSIRSVDMSPTDLFFNLQSVNLDHNSLICFSGLIHLPNIKVLYLNYNHIESIMPRQKTFLTNRQMLHNKVHSSGYGQQTLCKGSRNVAPTVILEPLMSSLEVLHLSYNGISNMANLELSRLTNLKTLFLKGNEISQVEGLEGLQQLRELMLDRNRIRALYENSFISQKVLLELHLTENRIRELNHLYPLVELRKLYLGMNKLQDIAELDKLEVLPSLTELSVVGNPDSHICGAASNVITNTQPRVWMKWTQHGDNGGERQTQCDECCSGSTLETNQAGLMTYIPVRGMSGLHNLIHGHDMLPNNKEEIQYTSKYKRQSERNPPSIHADMTSRLTRRVRNNMIAACTLPHGKKEQSYYHAGTKYQVDES